MGRVLAGIVGVVATLALPTVVVVDPVAAGTTFRVNPTALAFGSVDVGETKSLEVVVTNGSPQTLTPSFSGGELSSRHFRLLGRTCAGKTFASGESCTITVMFRPEEGGTFSAAATIFIDQVPYQISMTGTGVAASTSTTAPVTTTAPPPPTTTTRAITTTQPPAVGPGPVASGGTATTAPAPAVPPSATVVPAEVAGGDPGDGRSPLLIGAIVAVALAVVAAAVVVVRRRGRHPDGPDVEAP